MNESCEDRLPEGTGESRAAESLFVEVYSELRRLAVSRLGKEAPGQTLQPTALVHEAWLRLAGGEKQRWANKRQFFAAAAEAMRRILIDRARSKGRLRRGGRMQRLPLENVTIAVQDEDDIVLRIHEALDKLSALDAIKGEIVKLRYFVGMTHAEIAEAIGLSEPTVRRHWSYARAWMFAELSKAV